MTLPSGVVPGRGGGGGRWIALLAAIVQLAAIPMVAWSQQGEPVGRVWVNLRSGVYHCPGTTYYGKTSRGVYLPEAAARDSGYRANGGRACSADATAPRDQKRDEPRDTVRTSLLGPWPIAEDRGPTAPVGATVDCTVARIIDGDTIECVDLGSVRLIGIDTPELKQRPYGAASSSALTAMLPIGVIIRLEQDTGRPDKYRRRLSYLWHEGAMINWRLVREGWAIARRYGRDVRYATVLDSAQARAERGKVGLWKMEGFRCLPMVRRGAGC